MMDDGQIELLNTIEQAPCSEHQIFGCLEYAASLLDFEYICYGFRPYLPFNNARFIWLSNYPAAWKQRYEQANSQQGDPTVTRICNSPTPLLWDEALFAGSEVLWQDARRYGLNHGWSYAVLDEPIGISLLSLARSSPAISSQELAAKQSQMRWLTQTAHQALSRAIRHKLAEAVPSLTEREIEVLKWSADGKSAQDIAEILALSKRTVDFHIKNSVSKLNTPNKTAAVVRAVLLGLVRPA